MGQTCYTMTCSLVFFFGCEVHVEPPAREAGVAISTYTLNLVHVDRLMGYIPGMPHKTHHWTTYTLIPMEALPRTRKHKNLVLHVSWAMDWERGYHWTTSWKPTF